MNSNDIFISIVNEAMEEQFFTADITTNFELALFSVPHVLDGDLTATIARVREVLGKHPIRKAIHGPVMDLYYDSRDPKVQELAAYRIRQGLTAAAGIGAECMVAHSTYNPYFECSPKYRPVWLERSARFWQELVRDAAAQKVTVVIENIFDPQPGMVKELIQAVDSPFLKASIDTGHLNIFSRVPVAQWIETLGPDLVHTHLHNNYGTLDEHNGLDDGTFDFDEFFMLLKKHGRHPQLTIELKHPEAIESSRKRLEGLIA